MEKFNVKGGKVSFCPLFHVKSSHRIPKITTPDHRDVTHAPVIDPVWELYQGVIAKTGPLPTLIEWDTDVPEWDTLYHDVTRAAQIMTPQRAVA